MKKIFLIALSFISLSGLAQVTQIVMNAGTNGTTVNTCLGGLYDSGGTAAAADYSNNENYVVTICPDTPGDFITLMWTTFALDCTDNVPGPGTDADHITIYDGPTTADPTLGTYYCGDLQPNDIFGASPFNASGCLTIEFVSNANGTGNFNAQVSCETPCDPPTAAGEIVGGPTPDSIAVCIGDQVTFQDAGSTAGPSGLFTIENWIWKWMDGSPDDTLNNPGQVSHTFNDPGQYVVQLQVLDDNGCVNMNATDIQVFVTTYPTFDPFPGDTTICLGESLNFDAFPDQYEVEWSGFPLGVWQDDNCMEDLTGIDQQTPLTITGYDSNISLDAGNPDILSICVDMEHSFLGDFVLYIECPTGQTMTLHQQGGGGTYLGVPEDYAIDCNDPATFGVPWTYCFTPGATQTFVDVAAGVATLPAGDYMPVDGAGFSALDGCPINGTWIMHFVDNWGADDGSMPGWSINFDPALDPPVTVFTPNIGNQSDSSYWTLGDPSIISSSADGNSITVQPSVDGVYSYTYNVVNSFGCAFDSTINVTVTPNLEPEAGLDTSVCNGQPVMLGGQVAVGCDYTLDLVDTFGDGWNGNTIDVYINGVPTNYTAAGLGSTFTITVNHGDQIDLQWNATGNWQSECEIYFYDPDGNLIYSDGTGWAVPTTAMQTFTADCYGGMIFSWTPNDGSLDDVTSPTPICVNPNGTTTYTVTMYPIGHPDCATSDQVTVSVGGGLDAGTDSTVVFCFEGADEDLYTYLGGTPQPGGQWYDPSGNPIAMPITPATAADGLYEYEKDSAGCQVSAFIDVTIFTLQGATSVVDSDCQACNGEITLSSPNGVAPLQYSNDAGANYTAIDTYTGLCGGAAPGTNYSFMIMDDQGCVVTVDDDVEDINFPTLDPVAATDATCNSVCDGTVTLSGTNLSDYSIDNGANFQANGDFSNLCPGTYDVVVDNGFGCQVTDQFTITEPTPLQIDFISPDVTICPGETVTVTVNGSGGNGNYTYDWTANGTPLGQGTSIDVTANVNTQVCVTMSEDCPSPTTNTCMTISMVPETYPLMTSDVTNGCAPTLVTFTNLTNNPNIAETVWSFSDGTEITAIGLDDVQHNFMEPGVYDVSMTVTTVEGCVYDTTFYSYIETYDDPHANFTFFPIPATIYDTEVSFTDYSSDDVTQWMWNFGNGVLPTTSNASEPIAVYPEGIPGDYPVMLYVWNQHGCVDSTSGTVSIVNDVVVYAPNVFTPDGDEYNENWRVYIAGIDIYDFHLTIFNRYGEIIWESYNSEAAWNGSYGSRGLVQDGTYIWVIEAKDTYTDKKYEFRGHVTVLK